MEKGTHRDPEGHPVTISKEYRWTQKPDLFVTEVAYTDAVAIMAIAPWEFVDVTDLPRDQWPGVTNQPIIVGRKSA
jgi:hypothetical protein